MCGTLWFEDGVVKVDGVHTKSLIGSSEGHYIRVYVAHDKCIKAVSFQIVKKPLHFKPLSLSLSLSLLLFAPATIGRCQKPACRRI